MTALCYIAGPNDSSDKLRDGLIFGGLGLCAGIIAIVVALVIRRKLYLNGQTTNVSARRARGEAHVNFVRLNE